MSWEKFKTQNHPCSSPATKGETAYEKITLDQPAFQRKTRANAEYVKEKAARKSEGSRSSRNPPALQSITSTPAVHQPDLWEAIVTTTEGRAGEQEGNRRPRASVRWEDYKYVWLGRAAWSSR